MLQWLRDIEERAGKEALKAQPEAWLRAWLRLRAAARDLQEFHGGQVGDDVVGGDPVAAIEPVEAVPEALGMPQGVDAPAAAQPVKRSWWAFWRKRDGDTEVDQR